MNCLPHSDVRFHNGIPTLFVDGPCRSDGYSLPCDQLLMENTTQVTCFVRKMLARGKRRIGFIGD